MFFIASDIEPYIGRSRPSDKGGRGGGAVTKKNFGGPVRPQFGLKILGGVAGSPGRLPLDLPLP